MSAMCHLWFLYVTERKRQPRAMYMRERNLHKVMDNAPVGSSPRERSISAFASMLARRAFSYSDSSPRSHPPSPPTAAAAMMPTRRGLSADDVARSLQYPAKDTECVLHVARGDASRGLFRVGLLDRSIEWQFTTRSLLELTRTTNQWQPQL